MGIYIIHILKDLSFILIYSFKNLNLQSKSDFDPT